MLLAERFVLLLLDPHSGELHAPHRKAELESLCATGLLIDLIAQGRVRAQGNKLLADGHLPPSHPLLDIAHSALGHHALSAAQSITALAKLHSPLPQHLCDGLYRRDILHRESNWRFWRGARLRYPLRSIQAYNETAAFLHAARQHERVSHVGLLFLVDMAGALTRFLPAAEYEPAVTQLLDLGHLQSDESLRALALLRNALIDI